eukprot:557003-Alexandrium_andersonii.AAC.1
MARRLSGQRTTSSGGMMARPSPSSLSLGGGPAIRHGPSCRSSCMLTRTWRGTARGRVPRPGA